AGGCWPDRVRRLSLRCRYARQGRKCCLLWWTLIDADGSGVCGILPAWRPLGSLMDVTELLARAVGMGASDLHLAAGEVPMLRLDGELQRMDLPRLEPTALRDGLGQLLEAGPPRCLDQGRE